MDIVTTSKNIEAKIKKLDQAPEKLMERAKEAAATEAEYEKRMAITIARLENGETFVVEGTEIKDAGMGVRKEKAKGICWETKMKMIEAQLMYKASVKNADIICAQLNGWQSINRHLSTL